MGKRRLQLKAAAAANSAASLHKKASPISKDAPVHRGRKKRLEAKRRLEKKKSFIKTEVEKLEAESEKKKAKDGKKSKKNEIGPALAVLGKIADELKSDKQPEKPNYRNRSVTSHRQRTRIAAEESEQVKRVQEHEAFKSNPVQALRQHLMNTVSSDPGEIPPALEPGTAGAPKKRKQRVGEKVKKGSKDVEVSGLQVPDKEAIEKMREEAKERVARKKEEKAAYAAAAQKLKKRKTGGKIEKQTLSGLLGRGSRGRIGVKRPKI